MALAEVGYVLMVVLSDQGGNKSTLRFDMTATDAATAATDAATIIAALGAVTTAQIVSYSVNHVYQEDTDLYGEGESENVASISARIDSAQTKYATLRIPAPVDGIFQAAEGPLYNQIDPADTDLGVYLSVFATGHQALVSDGEALLDPTVAGNVTGKRIHRKSRKG